MPDLNIPAWLGALAEEDFIFLKRFLLASGSLKQLAAEYGVSYPTIRARLDRLIDKVRVREEIEGEGAFERLVQVLTDEGVLVRGTARTLMQAHKHELRGAVERAEREAQTQDEPSLPTG